MKDRIKAVRKYTGLTQVEFANRLGTVRSTVTNWEYGHCVPTAVTIRTICDMFGISEKWLATGEGDMLQTAPDQDIMLSGKLLEAYKSSPAVVRAIMDSYIEMDEPSRRSFDAFLKKVEARLADPNQPDGLTEESLIANLVREQAEA